MVSVDEELQRGGWKVRGRRGFEFPLPRGLLNSCQLPYTGDVNQNDK